MLKNSRRYSVIALITLALIIAGFCYWLHQEHYPSTDDAYIQAHTIDIASQVSGDVKTVLVKNQEIVQKGQVLFTIDPKPFQIALEQAKANLQNTQQQMLASENAIKADRATLAQTQAQYIDAKKNDERIMTLVNEGYFAKSGGDTATRQLAVAKETVVAAQDQLAEATAALGKIGNQNAAMTAARAAVSAAKLNLQYTTITAPENGQLAQMTLQPGQTVTAFQSLFSLVENKNWWAMANMKETNLSRVRIGQKAEIHVDMYPSHIFQGIVKSISPGSGSSFSLLPAENATGNWVKVTQRFPVRIEIINPSAQFPLRIGASCDVVIDTQHKPVNAYSEVKRE